jgi:hypothetical protein
MGSGNNPSSLKPDLFSAPQSPDTSSLSTCKPTPPLSVDEPAAASAYALPTNLASALKHLDDDQLDRLVTAVHAEQQRRGTTPPKSVELSRKRRTKEVAPALAQGKLNAVRAAFKAGVRPSRIARQFGISQSDVRKALASDPKK